MSSQFWLWLTTAIMTAGGLAILLIGKRRTRAEELQTVLHGIVPLIAACAYFSMSVGQGAITLPILGAPIGPHTTRVFYFARYIDWTFTTPLLLVSLAMDATHNGPKRGGAVLGVILADLMMILTALFFGASEVLWVKWVWFAISCVAFLGVYWVIWVSLLEANRIERDDVRKIYISHAALLSIVWLLYPVVLLFSPDGLYSIGDATAIACIAVLDVTAKVVYGFLGIASDAKKTDRDFAVGAPAAARVGAAPLRSEQV